MAAHGQGWLLSNNFCKACQNCLRPSFEFVQFDELSDIYRGLTPDFSKSKKDITKLISVHDSIIILLSFGTLFIHIRPWMAAQQSIL